MCRMFGYIGSSSEDLLLLFQALRSSAEFDSLAYDQSKVQHRDGWGYVIYSGGKVHYERFVQPIFSYLQESIPKVYGTTFAIFHARQAGCPLRGSPNYQHPFRGELSGGSVFLAHNGSMSRSRLAAELDQPVDTKKMVGSEAVLRYILQERRKGKSFEDATTRLQEFTSQNSALNVLILSLGQSEGPKLLVKHSYRRNPHDKDKEQYYQLKVQRFDSGGIAVFSSSLSEECAELRQSAALDVDKLTSISRLA